MSTLEAAPMEPTIESLQNRIAFLEAENNRLQLGIDERDRKIEILTEAHGEMLEQNIQKDEKILYDRLTGLKSFDYFEEEIRQYFSRARALGATEKRAGQEKTPMCLVMLDIDEFKLVNDGFGHDVGNLAIKSVANTIQRNIRDYDIAARWGGDEMVIKLLDVSPQTAQEIVERIRQDVSTLFWPEYPDLKITISAGIASTETFDQEDTLFKAADAALYASKHSGRNKVTLKQENTQ